MPVACSWNRTTGTTITPWWERKDHREPLDLPVLKDRRERSCRLARRERRARWSARSSRTNWSARKDGCGGHSGSDRAS